MVRDTWSDVNVVCHKDQSNPPPQVSLHPPSSPWLPIPTYKVRRLEVSDPSFTFVPKFKTFFKPDAFIFMSTP